MTSQESCGPFYDVQLLSHATTPADQAVQDLSARFRFRILNNTAPSNFWKVFRLITPELMADFKAHAVHHVRGLKEEGAYLYRLVANQRELFNYAQFDYEQFPLVTERCRVMAVAREQAQEISKEGCLEFDATCLYLLYFYGVLANPASNWVTMDYLTSGNKFHQYGSRLPDVLREKRRTRCLKCA